MAPEGIAPRDTYSVGEVCAEVRGLLRSQLAGFWVAGEVQRARASQRGHLYFELVEKGSGDQVVGKLEGVIWRRDHQLVKRELEKVDQRIEDGLQIRCWAEVDFYPPFGRVQLVVRRVDPLFTLGLLEKHRRETLEALTREGILDLNKQKSLPPIPLAIGLVTSSGSAAYHDFVSTLEESGFGFRVSFAHASVQGREAEREVASALERLGRLDLDCLVLIRGGGSRSDLAAFDSRVIAERVARSPLPVITGLGHEIDQSISDRVAHTATKTPTRAAELLVQAVAVSDRAVAELVRRLARAGLEPVARAARRVVAAERGLGAARFRLASEGRRLVAWSERLERAAARRLAAEKVRLDALRGSLRAAPLQCLESAGLVAGDTGSRIVVAARSRLREIDARLDGWKGLLEGLSPARTLARGFSVTRLASGRLVRSAREVEPGDRLTTELAAGTVRSRVEEER